MGSGSIRWRSWRTKPEDVALRQRRPGASSAVSTSLRTWGGAAVLFWSSMAFGAEVQVANREELRSALANAKPGDRIHVAPGTYQGGLHIENMRGRKDAPIVVEALDPANPPRIQGGTSGLHFSRAAYLELRDLHFSGQEHNGLNLDDGASGGEAGPVVLEGLKVSDVGKDGNHDAIKLSGIREFVIRSCELERWGERGSGVDMVGCHNGVLERNLLRHAQETQGSGIQCKGGSSNITIRGNRFVHAGNRGVNIGGGTGLQFFRPPLNGSVPHSEASDILVEGNYFQGCMAPVAFVGVDRAVVRYNTIMHPGRWALRILQENTTENFVPCREGEFSNNVVVFSSAKWASGGVNIGGGTAPDTFRFSGNWWYCVDREDLSHPSLPVKETNGTYGRDPGLDAVGNPANPSVPSDAGAHVLR
jgi:hypothetical protein